MQILYTLKEELRTALDLSKDSVPRSYTFAESERVAKVAIGMRRTGKTYFLFQEILNYIQTLKFYRYLKSRFLFPSQQ